MYSFGRDDDDDEATPLLHTTQVGAPGTELACFEFTAPVSPWKKITASSLQDIDVISLPLSRFQHNATVVVKTLM
jgi:hypothetical protein